MCIRDRMVGKRLLNKDYQITGIAIDKIGDAEKSLGELILEKGVGG